MISFNGDKKILGELTVADFAEATVAVVSAVITFTLLFLFG
ncbi:unnamed protein product [marine sediment metagenome]|uniref:Uncharacterized protein n=1 Tax=marine sediment metagenome TaxID=412755 RepID=X1U562_9ZZZZ